MIEDSAKALTWCVPCNIEVSPCISVKNIVPKPSTTNDAIYEVLPNDIWLKGNAPNIHIAKPVKADSVKSRLKMCTLAHSAFFWSSAQACEISRTLLCMMPQAQMLLTMCSTDCNMAFNPMPALPSITAISLARSTMVSICISCAPPNMRFDLIILDCAMGHSFHQALKA